jgi:hypothetical protein
MGVKEKGRLRAMRVDAIALVDRGANKKRVLLMKADTADETEARYCAHTKEESMDLNDTQITAIAEKVVALSKTAVVPPAPKGSADEKGLAKAAPAAAPAAAAPADGPMAGAIKGMREALTKANPPAPAEGDEEKTEEEIYGEMEELLQRLESLHAGLAKVKKAEVLSPATDEDKKTNVSPDNPNAPGAQARTKDAAFDLADGVELDEDDQKALTKCIEEKCDKLDEETESI